MKLPLLSSAELLTGGEDEEGKGRKAGGDKVEHNPTTSIISTAVTARLACWKSDGDSMNTTPLYVLSLSVLHCVVVTTKPPKEI